MATSSKATHTALTAMVTMALLAGTCTAQLPPVAPGLTMTIVNQLRQPITFTVTETAPVVGTQLFRGSVVVAPGQSGQLSLGASTAAGAVTTQTITAGNSVYAVQSTILQQLLGRVGAVTYAVSSPCNGNHQGLYVRVTSTLPLGSGANSNFCTGAPISA